MSKDPSQMNNQEAVACCRQVMERQGYFIFGSMYPELPGPVTLFEERYKAMLVRPASREEANRQALLMGWPLADPKWKYFYCVMIE